MLYNTGPKVQQATHAARGVSRVATVNIFIPNFSDKELASILEDPTRVWNADETGVKLDPGTNKIIAPKGMNNIFHVEKGKTKKQVTTLGTVSSNGDILPPFILLPYVRRPK